MKKLVLFLTVLFSIMSQAQETKHIPMINVQGEGKIKVTPDQACISVSQETKGTSAVDVKKDNDAKIDAILKVIKKAGIAQTDYLTQRVSLQPSYDYEKKQQEYIATQSVSILLKDISKYDGLMNALVQAGVNRIDNVEFKTTKLLQLQSDARKLAVKDAKMKAEDYVSVLGQKVGRAYTISDNSINMNPQPLLYASMKSASDTMMGANQTLAAGEIEVLVNVSISFILE